MPFWQKKVGRLEKQLNAAPPQCALLHLPHRVAILVEQNSTPEEFPPHW
jgi:hypothetical protein